MAIPSSIEYFGTITVTAAQLAKMNEAQLAMYYRVKGGSNSTLTSALNALSLTTGVIGLFLPGGAATVAGLVSATSGVAGSIPSYTSNLAYVMQEGCNAMTKMSGQIANATKYDLFEIQFTFIEFRTKNIRYIQGPSQNKDNPAKIIRAHVKGGGWVSWN